MTAVAGRAPNAAESLPPAPPYGPRAAVAKRVLARVLRPMPVTVRLDTGAVYGARTLAAPTLLVDDSRSFFARLARSPMIGIGESYMAGEWRAAPGTDLADVLAPFAERLTSLIRPVFYKMRHAVLPRGLNPENTVAGARKNIEAHYDLSNEMFATFLDPSMSYSSALFDSLDPAPRLEDLEAAQLRKVDAVLDQAGVTEGTRVLEIGTGWGTLAIRAAQRGAHVTTLTISTEQAALAQQRVDAAGVGHLVDIALRDYRDQDGTFDAIVSVEMIEAVGEKYWPDYFRTLRERLADDGKAGLQIITIDHSLFDRYRKRVDFIQQHIFPGGMLISEPRLQEEAARAGLKVTAIRRFGPDYARTLAEWARTCDMNWDELRRQGFDEEFRRLWRFYLAYCEAGFRTGRTDVVQVVLEPA